jgi:hypothetical protein
MTYHKSWSVLQDGGSGRWLYARRVPNDVYLFICIDDMVDACGKEAEYWFHAEVSVVDLNVIGPKAIKDACDSCGFPRRGVDNNIIAECCHSYGARGILWQEASPTIDKTKKDWQWNCPGEGSKAFQKLRANARLFADNNLVNAQARLDKLNSVVVNKIGQTAMSQLRGIDGLWDQLRDIKDNPNATADQKLILGMYQKAETTLGAGPIPEDIKE